VRAADATSAGQNPAAHAFGLSEPIAGSTISQAYGQAIAALHAAQVDPGFVGHTYASIGIYQYPRRRGLPPTSLLLDRLMAGPQAERQLALLERIYDSDAPHQAIADDLHMHRASLYNHLQRIADLIRVDPSCRVSATHLRAAPAMGSDPPEPLIMLDQHGDEVSPYLASPRPCGARSGAGSCRTSEVLEDQVGLGRCDLRVC
jgi:hypothetical protein